MARHGAGSIFLVSRILINGFPYAFKPIRIRMVNERLRRGLRNPASFNGLDSAIIEIREG
jgi:hypothetical protein